MCSRADFTPPFLLVEACGLRDLISKGNLAALCCPLIPSVSMVMFCSLGCCSSVGRQPAASVNSRFSCHGEDLKVWSWQAWPICIPGPRPYFNPSSPEEINYCLRLWLILNTSGCEGTELCTKEIEKTSSDEKAFESIVKYCKTWVNVFQPHCGNLFPLLCPPRSFRERGALGSPRSVANSGKGKEQNRSIFYLKIWK